jgi:NitT/TauT family transport system permease protein
LAWKAGITAEVLSNPAFSIGGRIYDAKVYLETTDLFVWTAVLVLISVGLEKLFLLLIRHARRKLHIRGEVTS